MTIPNIHKELYEEIAGGSGRVLYCGECEKEKRCKTTTCPYKHKCPDCGLLI